MLIASENIIFWYDIILFQSGSHLPVTFFISLTPVLFNEALTVKQYMLKTVGTRFTNVDH